MRICITIHGSITTAAGSETMKKRSRHFILAPGKSRKCAPITPAIAPLAPISGTRELKLSRYAAQQVEDQKFKMAEGVFDIRAEGVEIQHVAHEVQYAAVKEERGYEGYGNGIGDPRRQIPQPRQLIGYRSIGVGDRIWPIPIVHELIEEDDDVGQYQK